MFLALVLVGFFVAVVIHELGHAIVMHHKGMKIEEVGFGIGPGVPVRIRGLPPIYLRIIPVAAYVRATEQNRSANFSYGDTAEVYGAGIMANLLFASLLLAAVILLRTGFGDAEALARVLATVVIVGVVWIARRWFVRWGIPLVGCGILMVLLIVVVSRLSQGHGAELGYLNLFSPVVAPGFRIADAIEMIAILSLSLALVNAMPLYPLDGGKISDALLENMRVPSAVRTKLNIAGVPVTLAFLGVSIVSDVLWYLR